MPLTGAILEFESPVDNLRHPVAVCATPDAGRDGAPVPLVIEVSPGAITNLPGALALTERIADIAMRAGFACVAAFPTGRGPGSVYQDYGEVDVLETIDVIASRWPIDRDRISITGASMGGAATLYLASHYPDLFAAAAPFCGYADYRLWEKPGGLTFFMRPWEEASWRARSAALLVENLVRTPLWLFHGEWDRSVGGGVSVEHSRQLARRLAEVGAPHRYTEVPRTGHDIRADPTLLDQAVRWMLDQRKDRRPEHVTLVTGTLRHNRSEWVAIAQQVRSGERSVVDASFNVDGSGLAVGIDNVRALTLGPLGGRSAVSLTVDDVAVGVVDLGRPITLLRAEAGQWTIGSVGIAEKHHGQSGPIADLFHDGTLLVVGTIGSEEQTFFNAWAANDAVEHYHGRNGGVHRGGIIGTNTAALPVVRDVDLSAADRGTKNLLCYGTPASNAVLRDAAGALPVTFERGRITLGGREFVDPHAAVIAAFPHPENPSRYLAIHGGVTPDAITWGSHLDLGLLPDYLAYARGELLDWGFFTNDWRL